MVFYFVADFDFDSRENPVRAVAKALSVDELKALPGFDLDRTYHKWRDDLRRVEDYSMTYLPNGQVYNGAIYEVL